MTSARAGGAWRQRPPRDPFRLAWSAAPWAAAGYLISYLAVSWVLFAVAFTAVTAAAVLAIFLVGLPLLVAASGVIRGCANVERGMLAQMLTAPVRGDYRQAAGPGIIAEVKARWQDVATWRDLAYLVGLWVPLYLLDTIVIGIWLTFLAGITLPIWYWAPRGDVGFGYVNGTQVHGVALGYFPHGASGPGRVGLYVDTLPKALLAAAGFLDPVPALQLRRRGRRPRARQGRPLAAARSRRPAGAGQGGPDPARPAGLPEQSGPETGPFRPASFRPLI